MQVVCELFSHDFSEELSRENEMELVLSYHENYILKIAVYVVSTRLLYIYRLE